MRIPARHWMIGAAAVIAISIAAVVGFAAAVQAGFFRDTFLHFLSARAGRTFTVEGALHIKLFSLTPSITAERVTIGNPRWMPPGRMAEIGELALVFEMPRYHHRFGVESLTMNSAVLHLARDAQGRANWQWRDPALPETKKKLAIVRSLSMPQARVTLDDQRCHLEFEGTASAQAPAAQASSAGEAPPAGEAPEPLKIWGEGTLNGRAASFEITGDSLATASHRQPYHFSFSERSSGSRLDAQGALPRPFDFTAMDATFEANGLDLKDLYFLTGARLIDTGSYRLTGKLERDGLHFKFDDLSVRTGESDAHGSVSLDSTGARPKLDINLTLGMLRMIDLGARAAGRGPPRPPLLLSEAALRPGSLSRDDAAILVHADQVVVGKLSLRALAAKGTLDHGVLTAESLTAGLLGGELHAAGRLDLNQDPPLARADLNITGLELGHIPHKPPMPAPLEGAMRARIVLTGRGRSIHEVVSTSNGIVTLVVSGGTMRDSLAEATGMDLRGFGLLLSKDKRETAMRCTVGILKERDGTLAIDEFVADTEPVLITGTGRIQFADESLDLALRGEPKSVRLFHWRSPVLIKGTLLHPSIEVRPEKLQIIDRGAARDADCAALIAAADSAAANSAAADSRAADSPATDSGRQPTPRTSR
jgi:AsmA family protein